VLIPRYRVLLGVEKVEIIWKLGTLLEREGISVYKLHKVLEGKVSRNTLYKLANSQPERLDLNVLCWLITGLTLLTKKTVVINDLLETTP